MAIAEHEGPGCTLHVSVSGEPVWEKSSNGEEVYVRWLCWSIENGDSELVPPQFEVVSPEITLECLKYDLPHVFSEVSVVVDNDIEV